MTDGPRPGDLYRVTDTVVPSALWFWIAAPNIYPNRARPMIRLAPGTIIMVTNEAVPGQSAGLDEIEVLSTHGVLWTYVDDLTDRVVEL
jgi:hypothetical protein